VTALTFQIIGALALSVPMVLADAVIGAGWWQNDER